jgi:hypothetical protein
MTPLVENVEGGKAVSFDKVAGKLGKMQLGISIYSAPLGAHSS